MHRSTTPGPPERQPLCDTALAVGADEPTLCGDWTVKDLVVHLLVREGGPRRGRDLVAPLAGLTDRRGRTRRARRLPGAGGEVRRPRLPPCAVPLVDAWSNTLEFFVHHEDIRRAQPAWEPRT